MTRRRSMAPASSSRHWANLVDGPAGLIAERLLAHDVAEYIRFRAVCGSWRVAAVYRGLERRFLPRRWTLLLEKHAVPDRRRFLNLSTGECIQVCLPELRDHAVLAQTCDGLLVLLHRHDGIRLSLLNPLTRHITPLPPFNTLLPLLPYGPVSYTYFGAWGSGVLNDDDFTVVLSFNSLYLLGIAKLGDAGWTLLTCPNRTVTRSLTFAGRFYCVMVLKNHPPRLEVATKLHTMVSPTTDSLHLVENAGELMLVHRRLSGRWDNVNKRRYDVYRVDIDAGTLCRVNSLGDGGHALFIGMHCSLSLSVRAFPAGSVTEDTIYLRFDIADSYETNGRHLADTSTIPAYAAYNLKNLRLVALPHTLVDCLSSCV